MSSSLRLSRDFFRVSIAFLAAERFHVLRVQGTQQRDTVLLQDRNALRIVDRALPASRRTADRPSPALHRDPTDSRKRLPAGILSVGARAWWPRRNPDVVGDRWRKNRCVRRPIQTGLSKPREDRRDLQADKFPGQRRGTAEPDQARSGRYPCQRLAQPGMRTLWRGRRVQNRNQAQVCYRATARGAQSIPKAAVQAHLFPMAYHPSGISVPSSSWNFNDLRHAG